jgi:hypothetical protein
MSEENKSIIKQSAEKFSEHYSENPLTAFLLTALGIVVPQIALGKEVIDRSVSKIQKERFQTLLGELSKGEKLITPELIETEEFIHSFVIVYQASMNTFQREKIRRFARILLSAIEKDELASDKFEEFTRILKDLTDRELEILIILKRIENKFPYNKNDEDDFQRVIRYWEDFLYQVNAQTDTDIQLIRYIITGLERTGLYESFAGMILGYDGGIGRTTALFDQFRGWIKLENES